MIAWGLGLIMMLLDFGAQQWHIVLMEPGNCRSSMLFNRFQFDAHNILTLGVYFLPIDVTSSYTIFSFWG